MRRPDARSLVRQSFAAVGLDVRRRRPASRSPAATVRRPKLPAHSLGVHVAGLLELNRVELVLDVGGNVGAYGRLLREAGYAGRIASFEPVAAAFAELTAAAVDDPLWSVHPVALGRESGSRTITVMDKTAQSSFLAPSSLGRELIATLQPAYTEIVELRRLDSMFDEVAAPLVRPRTYLKMDTQGFDLEVLAGASGCLDPIVALQSELSFQALYEGTPSWHTSLETFEALGFAPTGFFPVGRDPARRLTECDCVLVRI